MEEVKHTHIERSIHTVIEQCNYAAANRIRFYAWHNTENVGGENTVAIFKIKWKF